MKKSSFSKKRIIHMCVIISIAIIVILIAIFLMFKYNVEGEKNLPFNLKSIKIVSTAESSLNEDEESIWHASILQKNNIYLSIEKNKNYKKQDAIKMIKLENFKITKNNENIQINMYRPTADVNTYIYSDEYKINDLTYTRSDKIVIRKLYKLIIRVELLDLVLHQIT